MFKINFIKADKSHCKGCCHNKNYCTRASMLKPLIGQCWFEEEY